VKLPDDPKERKKLYLAMIFGACAVLYGIYAGVVTPMRNSEAATHEAIAELERQISTAEKLIKRVELMRVNDRKVVREIAETAIHTENLIVPTLGNNYVIPSGRIIDGLADRCELDLDARRQIGLSKVTQRPGNTTKDAFRSYTVGVKLSTGLYPLLAFMRELETGNPYACISDITINARPGTPEEHDIDLAIQWPTWSDQNLRQELLAAASSETDNGDQTE